MLQLLGEAIIHKRHEVSQTDMDASAAVSQEMVGKKLTDILIRPFQSPDSDLQLPQLPPQLHKIS